MEITIGGWAFLVIGIILGAIVGYLFAAYQFQKRNQKMEQLAQIIANQQEERMEEKMKNQFQSLSFQALEAANNNLIKLAKETFDGASAQNSKELDSKKELIDQNLKNMSGELQTVRNLMETLGKERAQQYGVLTNSLQETIRQTSNLQETTNSLQKALSSSRVRGHWGERMAEDVLNLLGFRENINYKKQNTINTESGKSRPDFTFFLPKKRILNMDVKFPFENFLKYTEAIEEKSREKEEEYHKKFIRDVNEKIEQCARYINHDENTLDYILMFIPNEQIYAAIHEMDSSLLDKALQKKVIICNPLTLYAVLVVIRQAMDNFALEERTGDILEHLTSFQKEWVRFRESMGKLGDYIEKSSETYQRLVTTRSNKLDRSLERIENLRSQHQGLLSEENSSAENSQA